MDTLTLFALPALVGAGIGVLSGMLGIGGGTILVPVFRLLFNMSPVMSTATSLFTIIPTSVSGVASHVRFKTCVVSLGVATGLGGALTSPVGVWLASISPSWMIMVAAALIIGWSAVDVLRKAVKESRTAEAGQSAKGDANDAAPPPSSVKLTRKQLVTGAIIGLGAGLASGYVGVGGGFIMVPFMLSFVGIPMRLASGTSLMAVMILAVPGVIEQALFGNINYLAGIAVAVGSIPGAAVGARLVRVVPERTLRFIFSGFLLVAAVLLALNEFGILG
ncbi:MAG TPA: sulfite exporter TauE/SafE family protein [Candidatus Rubneribacter avistercoris]|nr:sulfite exporter TauE/SafE family protein [Candidatus Rubneribacter avistercoris]